MPSHPSELTVKELIDITIDRVETARDGTGFPFVREFSLAITALEDAQMRYARARHMQEGTFSPSDVDRWKADGADPRKVVAARDAAAGKSG
jgi:hypothetical protein